MREFFVFVAWVAGGFAITAALGTALEHRQIASHHVDEHADVRPGIIAVSASGVPIGVVRKPDLLAQAM